MKGAISSFFLIPLASVGSVNAVLPRARSIPVPCRSSSRNSRYAYPRVYGFARAQGTSDRNITLPRRHPPIQVHHSKSNDAIGPSATDFPAELLARALQK